MSSPNHPADRRGAPRLGVGPYALILFGCAALLILGALASGQPGSGKGGSLTPGLPVERPDGDKLVTPALIAERTAFAPGETGWIGEQLEIEDGWHVYWRHNGDTGAPMTFEFETTGPVRIGDAVYPAPERYLQGFSLDYIYEDRVTVLFPVEVSAAADVGDVVRITADVSWLVCKDVCLAGSGAVELQLPVAASSVRSDAREAFESARSRLPADMEATRRAGVRIEWRGSELFIRAPGARALTFFPYEPQRTAQPIDPIEDGVAEGDAIVIRYEMDDVGGAERVGGVLAVERPDGESDFFEIETAGPDR